jgi:hypothetical protein
VIKFYLLGLNRDESGGETFVAVMQSGDLREGDDLSASASLDRARV